MKKTTEKEMQIFDVLLSLGSNVDRRHAIIRIQIFIVYLLLISLMMSIQGTFAALRAVPNCWLVHLVEKGHTFSTCAASTSPTHRNTQQFCKNETSAPTDEISVTTVLR